MPNGGILTISTDCIEMDGGFVAMHGYGKPGKYGVISVGDTGEGMDEKTRARIFEPFFTTKGVGKGTGLGLAIAYGIIKQHSGYINVYSEPGRGTTFKIYLPSSEMQAKSPDAVQYSPLVFGSETILVAEDEDLLRKATKNILEKCGYSVIEATDGEDAVNMFREYKDKIDLVLIDVIMPKRNGREAYQEIQKMMPHIKVIFASGYTGDIVSKSKLLEEGFEFISKPISPRQLLRKIRELLDKGVKDR
jgi:CheY-like chemotaxis protein